MLPASDGEDDAAAFFDAGPGGFDLSERDRLDGDGELALCGHGEECGDGGEDLVKRCGAKAAAENGEIDAAQRGGRECDGGAGAGSDFDEAGAVRGCGFEALGEGFKEQFGGAAPDVVDDDVNAGGALGGEGLADGVFGVAE